MFAVPKFYEGVGGSELGLILAPWALLPDGPSLLPVIFLRELCPLLLGKLWGILQRRPLEYRFCSSQQEVFVSWPVTILSVLDLSAFLSLSQVEISSTHTHTNKNPTSCLDTPQLPRTVELQKPKEKRNTGFVYLGNFHRTVAFDGLGFCSHFGRCC